MHSVTNGHINQVSKAFFIFTVSTLTGCCPHLRNVGDGRKPHVALTVTTPYEPRSSSHFDVVAGVITRPSQVWSRVGQLVLCKRKLFTKVINHNPGPSLFDKCFPFPFECGKAKRIAQPAAKVCCADLGPHLNRRKGRPLRGDFLARKCGANPGLGQCQHYPDRLCDIGQRMLLFVSAISASRKEGVRQNDVTDSSSSNIANANPLWTTTNYMHLALIIQVTY